MQLSELRVLLDWIETNIRQAEITDAYQHLAGLLQSNMQPNSTRVSLEEGFTRLREILSAVPLHELTASQRDFLECMGIGRNVGRRVANEIFSLRTETGLDPASVHEKITSRQAEVAKGNAQQKAIEKALGECWPEVSMPAHGVVARITLRGESAVSNVDDLKKWAEKLYLIGYGYAVATGHTAQDVRLVRTGSGSVIFDFAADFETIQLIAAALKELANLALGLGTLYLAKRTLDKEGGDVDDVTALIDQKIEERLAIGVTEVGDRLVERTGARGNDANALRKAVEETHNLLEADGDIDLYLPPAGAEVDGPMADQVQELRGAVEEYRVLREREEGQRLLGGATEDDEQDDGGDGTS